MVHVARESEGVVHVAGEFEGVIHVARESEGVVVTNYIGIRSDETDRAFFDRHVDGASHGSLRLTTEELERGLEQNASLGSRRPPPSCQCRPSWVGPWYTVVFFGGGGGT